MNTVHTHDRGVVYKVNSESCKGRICDVHCEWHHWTEIHKHKQTYDLFGTGHHPESVPGLVRQLLVDRVECCDFLGVLNFAQFQMETGLQTGKVHRINHHESPMWYYNRVQY